MKGQVVGLNMKQWVVAAVLVGFITSSTHATTTTDSPTSSQTTAGTSTNSGTGTDSTNAPAQSTVPPAASNVATTKATPNDATTKSASNDATTKAASNDATTKSASNDSATTSNNETGSTATQPTTATVSGPVNVKCLDLYKNCTDPYHSNDGTEYCSNYKENKACFNASSSCNSDEQHRLKLLNCGPSDLFNVTGSSVSELCQGRITECMSSSTTASTIKEGDDFKTFFCGIKVELNTCSIKPVNKVQCSQAEYDAALVLAKCSAPRALVSSAILISIAILVQRIMKGC